LPLSATWLAGSITANANSPGIGTPSLKLLLFGTAFVRLLCERPAAYYNLLMMKFTPFTADYQIINNPANNRKRGPVSIYCLRLHAQFGSDV
jgi:hypothetical protein